MNDRHGAIAARVEMTNENKQHPLPLDKRILYGLTNWALLIAGLANLAAGTWAAFNESATIAATSLTAGLVLLFAATIDRFESLKGLGIEAKTKQLDEKIDQANDILRRLREITEFTGSALIRLNSSAGRWRSALEPREFVATGEELGRMMKSLGSDATTIAAALRPWAKTLCFDMATVLADDLRKHLHARMAVLHAELAQIPQPAQSGDPVLPQLNAKINSLVEYQSSRLSNLHLLELEDFPDKFMKVFDDVPQIDAGELNVLRASAAKFSSGMLSLRQTRTLDDPELWIEKLQKAPDR